MFPVVEAGEGNRAVQVARGGGNRHGGNAAALFVDDACIGCPAACLPELVGQPFGLCGFHQVLNQPRVGEGGAVRDVNGRPVA